MLDLRKPSGVFFTITGVILIAVSFTSPTAPMADSSVDLYTGIAMLAFGGILLALSRRGARA